MGIGQIIRGERVRHGNSLRDASLATGVHRSVINRIEKGCDGRADDVMRLCRLYRISLDGYIRTTHADIKPLPASRPAG